MPRPLKTSDHDPITSNRINDLISLGLSMIFFRKTGFPLFPDHALSAHYFGLEARAGARPLEAASLRGSARWMKPPPSTAAPCAEAAS